MNQPCVRARVCTRLCVCLFLRELSTCWWTRFDCACVAWCLTVAVAHQNTHGQLGHGINPGGDFGSHQLPKRVQGLEKKIVIKAAAGGHFSVVLTESNKVYAWGSNQVWHTQAESSLKDVAA